MNIATSIGRLASDYGSIVIAENGESAKGIFPYGDYLTGRTYQNSAGNSPDRITFICEPNSLKLLQKGDALTINDQRYIVNNIERIRFQGVEVYLSLLLSRPLEDEISYNGVGLPIRIRSYNIKRGTKIENISTISSGIFNEGAGSEPVELVVSGYVNRGELISLSSLLDSLSDNNSHLLQIGDIELNSIIGSYRLDNSHDDILCEITFTQSKSIGG
ncbi:MAG: hypothetical protein GX967_02290 [Clostridiales bacterium]|nr:hypothetical protein [Clostridiales bacterium]